jgi:hypothetical protein
MFSSLIPGSVVDSVRCPMASKSLQDNGAPENIKIKNL